MNIFQLVNACPGLVGRTTWDMAPIRQAEPYAILHAGPESIVARMHGGRVLISQTLDISLYHAPGERTPAQQKLLAVYEWVLSRRGYLTQNQTGQKYTVVNYVSGQPPEYDPDTQGLWANLSFAVQFIR